MNGYEYLMKFLKEEGFRMNEEETYFSFKYQGNNLLHLRMMDLSCKLLWYAIQEITQEISFLRFVTQ